MNAIGRSINSALQLSRIGGGVGISLSNLREAGAPIKGYEGAASGVVPVMKLFEDSFHTQINLVNVKVQVLFISMFSTQISWPFYRLRKKMPTRKYASKPFRLGLPS